MHELRAAGASKGAALSDARYRELFENIHEGFFVAEVVRGDDGRVVDFVFLEVNDAFTRQTGIAADVSVGRRVSDAIPGFPCDIVQRYGAVVDTRKPDSFEVEVAALEHRSYEARAHPLSGDQFAVLFFEITERKRIEKELEASRRALTAMVNSVDQIIWATRPDGYHDFFNRRWYEYTGVPPGSTDGEEWVGIFHPDDHERTLARWHQSLATGDTYEIEYRLRHRSGHYRWVLGRAHPVRNEAGKIVRWMGTCTDIHERKEFAEQRELAIHELSHRIKNIFAVISGLIALAVRHRPEAATFAKELTERIRALGEAHDYARPHGKDSARPDAKSTVLGLVDVLLKPYAGENQNRIMIEGDDVTLDERAATPVSLAIHELATNAAKYGAFSALTGQVHIRGERSADCFTLCWRERGGPTVREPERFGFGSRLVDVTLREQLQGKLVRTWRPEGLEVRLSVPTQRLNDEPSAG